MWGHQLGVEYLEEDDGEEHVEDDREQVPAVARLVRGRVRVRGRGRVRVRGRS